MAKKKKDAAPEAQNGTVASQGDKGPYIPALSMADQSKKYDVNTTAEKVHKRDWLIRIIALILLILLLMIGIGYCSVTILNKAGRFTVSLIPNEYGITLADDKDFTSPTLNLSAAPVEDMNNITKAWILNKNGELGADDPVYQSFSELASQWGEHNGKNYLAYTFGVRNASADDDDVVAYNVTLRLDDKAKGAEEAVRVMVIRKTEDGKEEATVYAKPRTSDGKLEKFAADKNFRDDETVFEETREDFLVGSTDRYTVIIWLEGEDPECVNSIMGGEAKFSMQFEVIGGGKANVG